MTFEEVKRTAENRLALGDLAGAAEQTRQLIAQYPDKAEAHYLNAQVLTELLEYSEAIVSAEQACKLNSKDHNYWFLCGSLYLHFKLTELAIPCLKNSISLEPRISLSHYVLGTCYQEEGQGDQAIESFRQALKLQPPHQLKSEIRVHLATSLFLSGRNTEAIPLLQRYLADKPKDPSRAILTLVEAQKAKSGSDVSVLIEKELQRLDLPKEQKRQLYLAKGQIALNDKNSDEAFANWEEAAAVYKDELSKSKDLAAILASIKSFYSSDVLDLANAYGHQSQTPVFIAGMPRSGTTLTEQIIAAHSQAAGVGERPRWSSLDLTFRQKYPSSGFYEKLKMDAANGELLRQASEILHYFEGIAGRDKLRIVEKTPYNFQHLGFFALLFPNARFIHTRRHPADVFISVFQNNFSPDHHYALDQKKFVEEYHFHEQLMDYWKSKFGQRIITIQYEKLTSQPELEARQLIEFLGLQWEPQCLKFHERKAMVTTFSTQQVRKPIYTSSVERWRVYEKHLGALFQAMNDIGLKYPPDC